jgi:hypothetical protein
LRENELLYSSHLPLGVPNGLVIHHASSDILEEIFIFLHEQKHLGEHPFESDCNENTLIKRWSFITEQCTKFNASYNMMKKGNISGIGVGELVFQVLGNLRVANQGKPFDMVHCWKTIKDAPSG